MKRALALSLVLACAPVIPAEAHGGPPLRLGVTADPDGAAVGRLVLLHLREAVGFAVAWQEFPDDASLRAGIAAGKLDVAVAAPTAADLSAPAPCTGEWLDGLRAALRERWGGEVFLVVPGRDEAPCRPQALVVARGVLEDLRFTVLRAEVTRVAAFTSAADVAAVRKAAEAGGERAAVAAARAALAAKGRR